MKILFDSQIFDLQRYGGISRYFSELFRSFNLNNNLEYSVPIRDNDNEYLKKINPFKEKNFSNRYFSKIKGKSLLYKIADIFDRNNNKNLTIRELKKQNFDIFHPTYYSTYFLKYLKNKPLVLTVYDMIHEIYPEYFFLDHGKTIKQKKKLILRADKIIAISESTKKDIMRFYNVKDDKIKVIYLGNSLSLQIDIGQLSFKNVPPRYILFVGSRSVYKNFIYFIESISILLNNDKDLHVIVAGGYSGKNLFSNEEIKIFTKLNVQEQILYYSADDKALAYLYNHAICFVFPTLYEGFGIPVLEAFACDCPVVISETSSLPEVGGDAAVYFNPKDGNNIMESVKRVIYDDNLRQEMIIKGKEQLKKFSWDKTSEETLKVYSSLI